jgi:hypothetical protein
MEGVGIFNATSISGIFTPDCTCLAHTAAFIVHARWCRRHCWIYNSRLITMDMLYAPLGRSVDRSFRALCSAFSNNRAADADASLSPRYRFLILTQSAGVNELLHRYTTHQHCRLFFRHSAYRSHEPRSRRAIYTFIFPCTR